MLPDEFKLEVIKQTESSITPSRHSFHRNDVKDIIIATT